MEFKLLPWVSFHHDLYLMVARPRGIVDEARLQEAVDMLETAEKEAARPFNRYTDLSKIDAIDLSFRFVFHLSLNRRLLFANFPPIKSAFYVTSPATVHFVKTHALLTEESPLEVEMFDQVAAAAKWLGVSVEDLEVDS